MSNLNFELLHKIIGEYYLDPKVIRVSFPPTSYESCASCTVVCTQNTTREELIAIRKQVPSIGVVCNTKKMVNFNKADFSPNELAEVIAFYDLLGDYQMEIKRIHASIEGYCGLSWMDSTKFWDLQPDFCQIQEELQRDLEAGNRWDTSKHWEIIREAWCLLSSGGSSVSDCYGMQILSLEFLPQHIVLSTKEMEERTGHVWDINRIYGYCFSTSLFEILTQIKECATNSLELA